MKHIKVRAELDTRSKLTFNLRVMKQPTPFELLGGRQNIPDSSSMFVHGDAAIMRGWAGQVATGRNQVWGVKVPKCVKVSLVLHKYEKGDYLIKNVPAQYWPSISAAIAAYNDFYKE